MANFKTHVWFGAVLAVVAVIFILISSLVLSDFAFFWVISAVLVGSFLPDLDSDEGLPFQILFGAFSLLCTGSIFYVLFQNGEKVNDAYSGSTVKVINGKVTLNTPYSIVLLEKK